MVIYCCGCEREVEAILVDGRTIYPHRHDLHELPFWKCGTCGNYVGCHHKTANRTQPLGVIPTPAIRKARSAIHAILDPLWESGRYKRGTVYAEITKATGKQFHSAEIRSEQEAQQIYEVIRSLGETNP